MVAREMSGSEGVRLGSSRKLGREAASRVQGRGEHGLAGVLAEGGRVKLYRAQHTPCSFACLEPSVYACSLCSCSHLSRNALPHFASPGHSYSFLELQLRTIFLGGLPGPPSLRRPS